MHFSEGFTRSHPVVSLSICHLWLCVSSPSFQPNHSIRPHDPKVEVCSSMTLTTRGKFTMQNNGNKYSTLKNKHLMEEVSLSVWTLIAHRLLQLALVYKKKIVIDCSVLCKIFLTSNCKRSARNVSAEKLKLCNIGSRVGRSIV